jgi:PHD/YefM family antitoxin component YafN of YafNO toxin-antitoxin module
MSKPQFESVSNFRNNYNAILQRLADGPLYLLQYSSPAAVVIAPEQWDAILDRLAQLDELEDQVAIYRHKWLMATGQAEQDVLTPAELEAWVAEDDKIPA